MEENGAISPSMLVPLRKLASGYDGGDSSVDRQLAVVVPTTSAITTTSSRFELPHGWYTKSIPRADGIRSDKYYYEPDTGKQFRSTKEVERYLHGVEYTRSRSRSRSRSHKPFTLGGITSSGSQKMIVSDGMLLRLDKKESNQRQLAVMDPTIAAAASPIDLPDGWVVEEVPRKRGMSTDKYYYEPGTGQKFKSLLSVKRYLAEVGENAPLSQMFKLGKRGNKKISAGKVKTSTSDIPKPPERINWVLADPGGHTWNPFIGESMIPEPIKQRWANRFTISMNERNGATQVVQGKVDDD